MRASRSLCLALLFAGIPASIAAAGADQFEFQSYKDLFALFERLNYTEETWNTGAREVPRVYLTQMPTRWRTKHSGEVEVSAKKEIFFRVLAPLLLRSNQLISNERERLSNVAKTAEIGVDDARWLGELAVRYKVADATGSVLSPEQRKELLHRVDTIPPSLAMAQTAEESGWGTSRFADLGNALFGQWAWGDNAIKPEQQRSGKGDYGIAAFDSLQDSVNAYMLNLNTHRAYDPLRARRAKLRAQGEEVRGSVLAETLVNYSERGEEYVQSLKSIIRVNKLAEIDEAHLADTPALLLVPVGEGAD